jgi:hypothetical protein
MRSVLVEVMGDLKTHRNKEIFRIMKDYGYDARPKRNPDDTNVLFERP